MAENAVPETKPRSGDARAPARGGPPDQVPGLGALFVGFLQISIFAFGGALPWARRVIVERKGWLSGQEFTDLLGLAQFLPGANLVNLSVALGARFHGVAGSLAALLGLTGVPFVVVIGLGLLYSGFGQSAVLQGAFGGVEAAAAGLMAAMAMKMAEPLVRARAPLAILVACLAFAAVALLRWPLHWVLLVLAPLSIALQWRRPR